MKKDTGLRTEIHEAILAIIEKRMQAGNSPNIEEVAAILCSIASQHLYCAVKEIQETEA
jgi:hypothetical protein